jgi:hypothetical protein
MLSRNAFRRNSFGPFRSGPFGGENSEIRKPDGTGYQGREDGNAPSAAGQSGGLRHRTGRKMRCRNAQIEAVETLRLASAGERC